MTEEINVAKVAKLARLKIKPTEEQDFRERFNKILDYVGIISEVEISAENEEKDESLQVVFRADQPRTPVITPETFSKTLENAFFKVPKIIE
jgi:aspartyl/glutamyl-tRNA(Asn/Gln) amidotransferase C subunit